MSKTRKQNKWVHVWAAFERKVKEAGFTPVRKQLKNGVEHWQIKGGHFTVNYYPSTTTIYINGTYSEKKGYQRRGNWADAIAAAVEIPPIREHHYKAVRIHPTTAKRVRRRLLAKDPHCHWCGRYVEQDARYEEMKATLDHVIPRERGGSNNADNLVLACRPCNDKRAADMPELDDLDWRMTRRKT